MERNKFMTQEQALVILKSNKNCFLTGEPGAGKTYTINKLQEAMRHLARGCAITASTGIAATHIGGITIHSWSGMKINRKFDKLMLDAIKFSYAGRRMQEADVLIIDEVSMLDATTITNLDSILTYTRNDDRPFGGLKVIFVGDFFQLPPVSKDGPTQFAFESPSWQLADLKVCYLTEQHRQSEPEFLSILNSMRMGVMSAAQKARLSECTHTTPPSTHLYTHNVDVDTMNDQEFDKLPGDAMVFEAETYGNEFAIATLVKNCLSPEILKLKEGAMVMFTSNNFRKGYVNGTIGKVVGFTTGSGSPLVKLKNDEVVAVEQAEWKTEENGKVSAGFKQYPLRLAWAITVHKSQGMSLDEASLDLSKCFIAGQGYVAISRVRSLEGLHLTGINDMAFAVDQKILTQDLIFREKSNEAI